MYVFFGGESTITIAKKKKQKKNSMDHENNPRNPE